MEKGDKIYLAGHHGLVGSAIMRRLAAGGYTNVVTRSHAELDLTRQADVEAFFEAERAEVRLPRWPPRVGGIGANSASPADFIYVNLAIALNVIDSAYKYGAEKLLNLGSSCIFPKMAASADEGGVPPLRTAGAHERGLRPGQDRGNPLVPALQRPVRYQLHQAPCRPICTVPATTTTSSDRMSFPP